MNKNKAKGTAAETAFVRWMTEQGYPCERRALNGKADRGDVAGLPFVIEIKSGSRLAIPQWLAELAQEMKNDNNDQGYLIIKPKGKGKVEEWWVVTTVGRWLNGTVTSHVAKDAACGCGNQKDVDDVQ